jgi:uncharacterized protein (TIGR02646 family)
LIRINKPATAPEKLRVQGKHKRKSHCQSFTRNQDAYKAGENKFEFDSKIYADKTVKDALISAQHKKCCFCKRLIGTDGDVEHFRPKQAYRQAVKQSLQYPGYYWLAYEWENLYLSCPSCNQRHKQNLFPLADIAKRAASHRQGIIDEQPLFIDPGKEDPEQFIGFRGEMPFAINGDVRGEATIKALRLGAEDRGLPEARLGQLQLLKRLNQVVQKAAERPGNMELQELAAKAKIALERAVQDRAEFAAAARWAIKTNFQYVID